MNKLEQSRKEINQIDDQIIALLAQRYDVVSQVGAYKKANHLEVLDRKREKLIIEKISKKVSDEKYRASIIEVFEQIMASARGMQK